MIGCPFSVATVKNWDTTKSTILRRKPISQKVEAQQEKENTVINPIKEQAYLKLDDRITSKIEIVQNSLESESLKVIDSDIKDNFTLIVLKKGGRLKNVEASTKSPTKPQ